MRVLLIEPDNLLARCYSRAFERLGDEVVRVRSAQAAVHASDEQRPDVVVLELQLARHNGVEFLYEFRSYGEWQDIPVVAHTYVPRHELIDVETLQAELGVRQVLYKPATSAARLCKVVQGAAAAAL